MNRRRTLLAVVEVAAWWAALGALWLVFVTVVDPLELAVGAGVAGVAALAARGARRAVAGW
ncbi:hypothetical protein GCM10010377_66220 [Streptomyces viridiviolaceus]|uniref:Uncharacterized protein n=1 Tax=Streptomyces viridiviolaceus TaxID=68282 RepID=A0ABW2EE20_9ACTN|nr:hypothetical protein [Streptomyces viridiviolaceus]GHB66106.1 hypothetical protein GCM10010377_66220 [Streptomyces viridiviolaceus]